MSLITSLGKQCDDGGGGGENNDYSLASRSWSFSMSQTSLNPDRLLQPSESAKTSPTPSHCGKRFLIILLSTVANFATSLLTIDLVVHSLFNDLVFDRAEWTQMAHRYNLTSQSAISDINEITTDLTGATTFVTTQNPNDAMASSNVLDDAGDSVRRNTTTPTTTKCTAPWACSPRPSSPNSEPATQTSSSSHAHMTSQRQYFHPANTTIIDEQSKNATKTGVLKNIINTVYNFLTSPHINSSQVVRRIR